MGHICVDRGVRGGLCGLLGVHVDVDPGVRECLCVCVCSLSLHRPLRLPSQVPTPTVLSKPTARRCPIPSCMHLAALSISVCLTKRKLSCLGGPLYLVPPVLAHCAVLLAWGLSLPPLPQYAVSQELQPQGSERGPRQSSAPHTLPHPPRRARVGVAVMASVDIL